VAASSRRKGIRGEGDVARIFRAGGVTVEKLQQQQGGVCDLIAGDRFYVDVKRAERLKLPEWLRQAADEAPQGTVPVVAFRQNRGEWYAALPLAALVELAG
jgi:hypothetical protein